MNKKIFKLSYFIIILKIIVLREDNDMKMKLAGIIAITLLVANAFPALGTIIEKDNVSDCQNIGDRGGLFRQLPSPPDDPMPTCWPSDLNEGLRVYEDFMDVSNPICHIHWWGQAIKQINDTWYPGNPEGMVFDIIFYEDDSGSPGTEVYTFSDISPIIIGTGIMYEYPDWPEGPSELYYFEADLNLCFDLSNGWVSIIKKYSSDDSIFGWSESSDGNDNLYWNYDKQPNDVAFILAESGEPDLEINVKGGLGVTANFNNIGNETITNAPVDLLVYGGMLSKINKHKRITIDTLPPDINGSIGIPLILGFGKISIGVIADNVVEYKSGFQLLFLTIIK